MTIRTRANKKIAVLLVHSPKSDFFSAVAILWAPQFKTFKSKRLCRIAIIKVYLLEVDKQPTEVKLFKVYRQKIKNSSRYSSWLPVFLPTEMAKDFWWNAKKRCQARNSCFLRRRWCILLARSIRKVKVARLLNCRYGKKPRCRILTKRMRRELMRTLKCLMIFNRTLQKRKLIRPETKIQFQWTTRLQVFRSKSRKLPMDLISKWDNLTPFPIQLLHKFTTNNLWSIKTIICLLWGPKMGL